jgi:hypothetical protein
MSFRANELKPHWNDETARPIGVKLTSNIRYLAGTILAFVSAVAANAQQTLTGTATSGETYLEYPGWGITTTKIAYNATAAQVKACLETIPGFAGNIQTSGGALGTNPVVVTFINRLAGLPQTLLTKYGSTLAGGDITIANTTTGVANGRWMQADMSKLDNPTTGPSVSAVAGGTFPVGSYICQMAWVTPAGETLPSQGVAIAIADSTNDAIRFAAINAANTPDEATAIRYYINGILAAETAVATGAIAATDVLNMPTSGQGTGPATVNTAYKYSDGRQQPKVFLRFDTSTGPGGDAVRGSTAVPQHAQAEEEAQAWIGGYFMANKLIGLTQEILTAMGGRIIKGALSDPANCLVYIPA